MVYTRPDLGRKPSVRGNRGGKDSEKSKAATQVAVTNGRDVDSACNIDCQKCSKPVEDGVQCDRGICALWWHLDCGNISRAEYNVTKKRNKSLMWFVRNVLMRVKLH